jgi:hypothetical protein
MIGSYEVEMPGGDLGVATTPRTGFGTVAANLSAEAINARRRLGENLASSYDGAQLPDGTRGFLDFRTRNTDHVT